MSRLTKYIDMSGNSKRNLYLLTDSFPYGQGEKSFIIPELPYLQEKFCVTIISCATQNDRQNQGMETKLEQGIHTVHYSKGTVKGAEVLSYVWGFLLDRECRNEIKQILFGGRYLVKRIKSSLFFYANAVKLKRWLIENGLLDKSGLYYSYWYNYHVLSLVMVKKSVRSIITRAHGYDLYEDQTDCEWQPYKKFMDQNVDKVVFISKHGYEYYIRRYATEVSDRYQICKLGISKQEAYLEDNRQRGFLLVSCSMLIPLKRVELIIEGLARVKECPIQWVHFGSGEQEVELNDLAMRLLAGKSNITYELKGYQNNADIMNFYAEYRPNCFITTSANEGLPVSVQEAIAFGIPVIGTAVGGIPEMIEGNGYLLSRNPSAEDIADAIEKMCKLENRAYISMRKKSVEIWSKEYDVEQNMCKFVDIMKELSNK